MGYVTLSRYPLQHVPRPAFNPERVALIVYLKVLRLLMLQSVTQGEDFIRFLDILGQSCLSSLPAEDIRIMQIYTGQCSITLFKPNLLRSGHMDRDATMHLQIRTQRINYLWYHGNSYRLRLRDHTFAQSV